MYTWFNNKVLNWSQQKQYKKKLYMCSHFSYMNIDQNSVFKENTILNVIYFIVYITIT